MFKIYDNLYKAYDPKYVILILHNMVYFNVFFVMLGISSRLSQP